MPPKRANSKAAPSIDDAAKAALLANKKGKALADATPKWPSKTTLSIAKGSAKTTPPPTAPYTLAVPKMRHRHHRQAPLHQRTQAP
jgi:hypothetical protein